MQPTCLADWDPRNGSLAATHKNKSPGDYIWDFIEEHVQADLADLQRNLDDLVG